LKEKIMSTNINEIILDKSNTIITDRIPSSYIIPYILCNQIKLKECDNEDLEQVISNLITKNTIYEHLIRELTEKLNDIYYRRGVSY
jgi:predicted metallo-beta-lactamase superfamily hydrolase